MIKDELVIHEYKAAAPLPWPEFRTSRAVAEDSMSSECVELIKSWVRQCCDDHTNCKNSATSSANSPKRLLDIGSDSSVSTVKLINASGLQHKYSALSYCWGNADILETTPDTLDRYSSDGIAISHLPKTFQDAIDISQKLDVQFIWIDSICIVQGDKTEWEQECPKMGDIYGNAYLVIAASLAQDGSCGCYVPRPRTHRIQFQNQHQSIDVYVREKINHDVWKKDEPYWGISELPLLGRAWAFQERLLATRMIHYTSRELVWECRSCVSCECGALEEQRASWAAFPAKKNFKTRYAEVVTFGSDVERLNLWHTIGTEYTSRRITNSSDRLPALSAIAKQVDMPGILGNYLAGIWSCTLPGSLLWWSDTREKACPDWQAVTHWRPSSRNAPTWSWLSVEGPVDTCGRNPVSEVQVLHISYTLATSDMYGQCCEASIIIAGQFEPIEIHEKLQANGDVIHEVRSRDNKEVAVLIPDTHPLEIPSNELSKTIFVALKFSRGAPSWWNCLILRVWSNNSNVFQRVGIAELGNEWFHSSSMHRVAFI